jgi:hypothetical protein
MRESATAPVAMTIGAAPRSEHISLESAPESVTAPPAAVRRKVRATYALKSSLRGCSTELSLLEDHFVAVRSVRPGADSKDYVLDLRFANAKPVLVRRIAWTWLVLSLVFGLLAAAAGWLWHSANAPLVPTLSVGATMLVGAGVSLLVFLRRTTESLEFTSVHGQVALISVTGGIGSVRASRASTQPRPRDRSRSRNSCATRCASITACAASAC